MTERITTAAALERWLGSHASFEDGFLEVLDPLPGDSIPPIEAVRMTLAYQVGGGWRAGEHRLLRSMRVVAHHVSHYQLPAGEHVVFDNCMEDVECFSAPNGLGLRLTVPAELEIVARHLEVESATERTVPIEARVGEREIAISLPSAPLPTPSEWADALAREGLDVCWRLYGGEARPPETVPSENYTGWFIQLAEYLDSMPGGLLLHAVSDERGSYLSAQRMDAFPNDARARQRLLYSIASHLASHPEARVHSGNCLLTGPEWLDYAATGRLPKRLVID